MGGDQHKEKEWKEGGWVFRCNEKGNTEINTGKNEDRQYRRIVDVIYMFIACI